MPTTIAPFQDTPAPRRMPSTPSWLRRNAGRVPLRTVEATPHAPALLRFLGKPPDQVTSQDVFSGSRHRTIGKRPSAVTIGARIACLSSFYRFLIRMGWFMPILRPAGEALSVSRCGHFARRPHNELRCSLDSLANLLEFQRH